MRSKSKSPIVIIVSRMLSPFIMLFGLYVIFHGHYSPGGGFQGGAVIAASIILIRIANDFHVSELQYKSILGMPLGSLGVLIFYGIGFIAMFFGNNFLDYEYLTFAGLSPANARSIGILLVEVGVGLAVVAILVSLFDNLLGEGSND